MMDRTAVSEMCHDCGRLIHGARIYTQDESVFHPDCYPHGSAEDRDEITRLRAEVERLRAALDYRTDLNRVTYDDDGHLDEIVTDGGAHMEHMGDDSWFMNLWRGDGTGVALWFTGKVTSIEFEDAVLCPACSKRPLLIDNGLLACECGWSARAALHEGRQDADG